MDFIVEPIPQTGAVTIDRDLLPEKFPPWMVYQYGGTFRLYKLTTDNRVSLEISGEDALYLIDRYGLRARLSLTLARGVFWEQLIS